MVTRFNTHNSYELELAGEPSSTVPESVQNINGKLGEHVETIPLWYISGS